VGALPDGGHLGEGADPCDLLLDDVPLGAKLGLRHVPLDDPELPRPLEAGFERLHAEALIPLAPVPPALLESSLHEVASGLLEPLVGVTGPEPVARRVITCCPIGNRGSLAWFVLKYLLEYPNVAVYHGSYVEWGKRPGSPIEPALKPERPGASSRCADMSVSLDPSQPVADRLVIRQRLWVSVLLSLGIGIPGLALGLIGVKMLLLGQPASVLFLALGGLCLYGLFGLVGGTLWADYERVGNTRLFERGSCRRDELKQIAVFPIPGKWGPTCFFIRKDGTTAFSTVALVWGPSRLTALAAFLGVPLSTPATRSAAA